MITSAADNMSIVVVPDFLNSFTISPLVMQGLDLTPGKSNHFSMMPYTYTNVVNSVDTSKHELHWILDSGASYHISRVKSLFQHLRKCDTRNFVRIPNGTTYHIEYVGEFHISPTLYIHNVL